MDPSPDRFAEMFEVEEKLPDEFSGQISVCGEDNQKFEALKK